MPNESQETSPYESTEATPQRKLVGDHHAGGLSAECCGNLTLTAKLVRVAAVFCAFGSLVPLLQVLSAYHFYGLPARWTWWHISIGYRVLYTPCFTLLAWMFWRYATNLQRMATKGISEVEEVVEQQAKAWLAVGLLMFVMIIGVALTFSNALYDATN